MLNFTVVTKTIDVKSVASLAHEIWNSHYVPIIGQRQVDYMLANFQCESAIKQQIADHFRYFLVKNDTQLVGYFALTPIESSKLQISKLYVIKDRQCLGIGGRVISFIEADCFENDIAKLWLTVNRHNAGAISFYEKVGFRITNSLVQKIGNGFIMDDYEMIKILRTS